MVKVADYIQTNIAVFSTFVKLGSVPQSIMNQYKIYTFYKSLDKMPSKMDRYTFTAESLKTNVTSVRDAVREMERNI